MQNIFIIFFVLRLLFFVRTETERFTAHSLLAGYHVTSSILFRYIAVFSIIKKKSIKVLVVITLVFLGSFSCFIINDNISLLYCVMILLLKVWFLVVVSFWDNILAIRRTLYHYTYASDRWNIFCFIIPDHHPNVEKNFPHLMLMLLFVKEMMTKK